MSPETDEPPHETVGGGRATAAVTARDRVRQIVVTASYLVCVIGSAIGVGAFGGTSISQAAGGALSADATLLAPASGAFSIWTVVYVGLAGYTICQWFPRKAVDRRHRLIGWWAATSMVLNAAWILVVQAGWIWFSVVAIAVLLAVLARIFVTLVRHSSGDRVEALLSDGTFGVYLGWVCLAICANVAAALVSAGFDGFGLPPAVSAVAVLVAVAAGGVGLAVFGHGRFAPAIAIVWGLAWVVVARTTGEPHSAATALAAGAAAVVVAGTTIWQRLARGRASR